MFNTTYTCNKNNDSRRLNYTFIWHGFLYLIMLVVYSIKTLKIAIIIYGIPAIFINI